MCACLPPASSPCPRPALSLPCAGAGADQLPGAQRGIGAARLPWQAAGSPEGSSLAAGVLAWCLQWQELARPGRPATESNQSQLCPGHDRARAPAPAIVAAAAGYPTLGSPRTRTTTRRRAAAWARPPTWRPRSSQMSWGTHMTPRQARQLAAAPAAAVPAALRWEVEVAAVVEALPCCCFFQSWRSCQGNGIQCLTLSLGSVPGARGEGGGHIERTHGFLLLMHLPLC